MEINAVQEEEKEKNLSDDAVINERKEKVINYFKSNYNWIIYILLAAIVFLSIKIRSSNIPLLKDITTGDWTLGPDLDPFLFLRWAEHIVANGSLFAIDMMRYAPLGLSTTEEYLLHPYMIAWFHRLLSLFGFSDSVTYSAILYPVFFFALTVIAFFLMTRSIFKNFTDKKSAGIIALIASLFLTIFPVLLPRTIAGIPEKESASFFYLFLAFYFFLESWQSDKKIKIYLFAALSALSTLALASNWGGYIFIFVILVPAVFISFLLGKMDKEKTLTYSIWFILSFVLMNLTAERFSLINLFTSVHTSPAAFVFLIILIHNTIHKTKLKNYMQNEKLSKIPPEILSLIITALLAIILSTTVFGFSFIPNKFSNVMSNLVGPPASRLIQTVAENKQPFFNEWAQSFGPSLRGVYLTLWIFILGLVYLFYKATEHFEKKVNIYLTISFAIFLAGLIFSSYSEGSIFNGTSVPSLIFYFGGFLLFASVFGYYYYKHFKEGSKKFTEINFGIIFVICISIMTIIAAKAAIRTVMVLASSVSILVAYSIVSSFNNAKKSIDTTKMINITIAGIIILASLFSAYTLYKETNSQAAIYAPGSYNQQWQKAMSWVRENTQEDAIFSHWWDYGYWLQSIGERTTVLDGGNAISYWNHLMGRHALTSNKNEDSLQFLYSHNVTHFLIDSTDIGKYGAFSLIGSDEKYDRASYIPVFTKNAQETRETKNATLFVYTGGSGLDEDIIYDDNGSRVFLPANKAGIGAIIIQRDASGKISSNPLALFIDGEKQYNLPLRYVYDSGVLTDFGSGLESGIYIFPRIIDASTLEMDGTVLYLSRRTVSTQLARLYLYKEENPYFKLVHSQDDAFVELVKAQNPGFNADIIYYQGIRGPIRIWEVSYPQGMEVNPEYLKTDYPKSLYYR